MPSFFEDFSKRNEGQPQIKNLDELSAAIKKVSSEWLKVTGISEHELRLKEADILKALQTLDITEEWKSQNIDLVANFIQVADTRTLKDELKKIFFLNNIPDNTISARQTLDKINFMKNRKN